MRRGVRLFQEWVRLLCVWVTVHVRVSSAECECVPDRETVCVSMVGVVQVLLRAGVVVQVWGGVGVAVHFAVP